MRGRIIGYLLVACGICVASLAWSWRPTPIAATVQRVTSTTRECGVQLGCSSPSVAQSGAIVVIDLDLQNIAGEGIVYLSDDSGWCEVFDVSVVGPDGKTTHEYVTHRFGSFGGTWEDFSIGRRVRAIVNVGKMIRAGPGTYFVSVDCHLGDILCQELGTAGLHRIPIEMTKDGD